MGEANHAKELRIRHIGKMQQVATKTMISGMGMLNMRVPATSGLLTKSNLFTGYALDAQTSLPKRPMSPFFLYINEVRPRIVAQNPGLKMKEVPAIAKAQYERLSASKKGELAATFAAAKVEYKKEFDRVASTPEGMKLIEEKKKGLAKKPLLRAKRDLAKLTESLKKPKRGNFSGWTLF